MVLGTRMYGGWSKRKLRGCIVCNVAWAVIVICVLFIAARRSHQHQGGAGFAWLRPLDAPQQGGVEEPEPLGYSPPDNTSGIPGFAVQQQVSGADFQLGAGWYELAMDYRFPPPDSKYLSKEVKAFSCYEAAASEKEPLTHVYKRRHAPPTPLPGSVPRAFFRWEGNITRQQFDAVPELMRGTLESCLFCMGAVRYQVRDQHASNMQPRCRAVLVHSSCSRDPAALVTSHHATLQIIEGHLYRTANLSKWTAFQKQNVEANEDLLLTVLHLWDLPDMDIIMHNGDGCPPEGFPMLSWTICRDRKQGGFGWPTYTFWRYAYGPMRTKAYHQCMITRYNLTRRRPVVFWRGSTTDPLYSGMHTISRAFKVARIKLHKLFEDDPVFDTKLNNIIEADDCTWQFIQPLAGPVPMEDYARAAVALDIDGHGASFRFGHHFVHLATPILKQASNNTAYFEHLIAPGAMAEYYQNDLSDLRARGYDLVDEWNVFPDRLMKQAEQLQGFAAALMHQIAVAEAAAYSLLEYSKRQMWKTKRDPTYVHVPFSQACGFDMNRLPEELCAEMRARPARP